MDLLLNYLKKWHTLLTNFALEGEFKSAIFSAIKSNNSNQYITQLNNQVKVASYESLPKVEIINSTFEIKSAVYSSSNETIYLNENWLTEANPNNIFEALTEEHCHHIDYKSHSKDTPRDKGFLFAAKLFKKPFILEVRDLYPQVLIDQGGRKSSSFFIKFFTMMEKFLYRNSSHIIVLAKGSKKYVKEKGGLNISWLPNGPDLKKFKCEKNKKEPEKFSFSNPFKIYYTGAHGDANSLHTVIDAARLLEKFPILLILVGDGPEKENLIKYSKGLSNVIFKDSLPKKEMPHLLKDANAILICLKNVQLFRYGVSPNKLYDAYALAKPVITNVPGDINNEVESNYLGVTAKPEDPKDLALAIKNLFMKTPEEREKISQNARKIAEKIYSREKIINRYDQILKKIIK